MKPKTSDLPMSPVQRMAIIQELLAPAIYDEDGETIIGYSDPLITPEQAKKLLNCGMVDDETD